MIFVSWIEERNLVNLSFQTKSSKVISRKDLGPEVSYLQEIFNRILRLDPLAKCQFNFTYIQVGYMQCEIQVFVSSNRDLLFFKDLSVSHSIME
jgi:hypothetical protein